MDLFQVNFDSSHRRHLHGLSLLDLCCPKVSSELGQTEIQNGRRQGAQGLESVKSVNTLSLAGGF